MLPEHEFQNRVLNFIDTAGQDIATIKEQVKSIEGLKRTVYGQNGSSGLVAEMRTLKNNQSRWNRGLSLAAALLGAGIAWIKFWK